MSEPPQQLGVPLEEPIEIGPELGLVVLFVLRWDVLEARSLDRRVDPLRVLFGIGEGQTEPLGRQRGEGLDQCGRGRAGAPSFTITPLTGLLEQTFSIPRPNRSANQANGWMSAKTGVSCDIGRPVIPNSEIFPEISEDEVKSFL